MCDKCFLLTNLVSNEEWTNALADCTLVPTFSFYTIEDVGQCSGHRAHPPLCQSRGIVALDLQP